ncbi:PREDICTED: histone deacetylase complex subunit SAP25 isoform X1 [Dipodomys ordii]|uniref:Histone deacetylase complex subunit SAP25 isoform X1 n=1 Tax=Dipodomys ordii TaxID=10020 RepID=A0A1S3GEJ6_DIPOR|nr:PREDICTED: histone deacetylase complex subunit SAP25 isoform X1 [Dipodomys ordii]
MLSWPCAPQGASDGGMAEVGVEEGGREDAEEPGEEEDVEEQDPGEEEEEDAEEQGEVAEQHEQGGGQSPARSPGEPADAAWAPASLHLQASSPLHSRAGPWVQQELLPRCPPHLVTGQPPASPVPPAPKMTWEVTSSRTAVLSPWDPNYESKTRSHLTWGPGCGSGASFSNRTMCHPSFYPLYEAAGRGYPQPVPPGRHHHNGQSMPRDAGVPVMCREDFFLLDPLLPHGQRVPLYLAEPPHQAMGPMKLLLLPPVMTPWVYPSAPQGSSTTAWLSGPELIALTGLLQMSQGEQRRNLAEVPLASTSLPEPNSNPQETSGHQSCCDSTSPSVTQGPDSHCS